jgi:hypothetical protein
MTLPEAVPLELDGPGFLALEAFFALAFATGACRSIASASSWDTKGKEQLGCGVSRLLEELLFGGELGCIAGEAPHPSISNVEDGVRFTTSIGETRLRFAGVGVTGPL